MLQAYSEREQRIREWDLDKLRFLARVWGMEVPSARERMTTQDKYALLRRLGGKVVEVH